MTVLAESVLAYTSSLGGVGLLWYLSARNRAEGWRRPRHPNCFQPLPVALESRQGSEPTQNGTAQQLLALSRSVMTGPRQDHHDQNCECPETVSTSRT
jgi:hypothetical protein